MQTDKSTLEVLNITQDRSNELDKILQDYVDGTVTEGCISPGRMIETLLSKTDKENEKQYLMYMIGAFLTHGLMEDIFEEETA